MSDDIKNQPIGNETKPSSVVDDPRCARIPRAFRDVIKFEATSVVRRAWPAISRCGIIRRATRRHR